jgi:hypothetical protein
MEKKNANEECKRKTQENNVKIHVTFWRLLSKLAYRPALGPHP